MEAMIIDSDNIVVVRVVEAPIPNSRDHYDPRLLAAYDELRRIDPQWDERTAKDRLAIAYQLARMTDE